MIIEKLNEDDRINDFIFINFRADQFDDKGTHTRNPYPNPVGDRVCGRQIGRLD
jgi:hypothetical protein